MNLANTALVAPGVEHCVRTLNGLLGHPQQSSLRPFPHKRGRKLWGLPLVTHGGSDPCQIHVWETFSEIIAVCILIRSRRRHRRPSLPVVQAS
jgi:hypothetical protein